MSGAEMAQAILDMFPDAVSDHGLIGCGLFTLSILAAMLALRAIAILRR